MEVRAKKSLGQHFLTDLNIARKIAAAVGFREKHPSAALCSEPNSSHTPQYAPHSAPSRTLHTGTFHENPVEATSDVLEIGGGRNADSESAEVSSPTEPQEVKQCVLEIGGGMGVLTQFLLERDDVCLWGIEIDRESIAYMRSKFPDFSPRLIEGDFLKMDLREKFPQGVAVVGNFPYNISSQIFFKVLENRDLVPEVVGMVQREVALRIAEPPGSRTYGILSVLLQAWYDIEYLFTVSESVFSPPPKVKSAVIRLRRNSRSRLDCDEALFVRVVKAAFNQRRKMLRNSLGAAFPELDLSLLPPELATSRPEQLSVDQFVELTNLITNYELRITSR